MKFLPELSNITSPFAAVLLVRSIRAVHVAIASPHLGNALARAALELMIGTGRHITPDLVLSVVTVQLGITTLVSIQTERTVVTRSGTLELRIEALVIVAVLLIGVISALIDTVTDRTWADALVIVALELTGFAGKLRAVIRFVAVIAAVVLLVALPVVRDTFEGRVAEELSR